MTNKPVFRFAPSPNGELHLGHAYSALLNADLARAANGRLLLRMEDIDLTRCRPKFERQIEGDLAWLGISWEKPVRRQSEHFAAYQSALDRLRNLGLIYPAFMSRAEFRRADGPSDPDGAPLYPGFDRDLPEQEARRRIADGAPFAWRLRMDAAAAHAGPLSFVDRERGTVRAQPELWGDVILARKDIPTSYHLSVVVDDALQGVTEVVRGEDLFAATGVHRLLQALLDLPQPIYRHHCLIRDAADRKLAKSDDDTGLASLRENGANPADIRRMVGLDPQPTPST